MGIRMEKAVVQYLLAVIFRGFLSDLRIVISQGTQFLQPVNLNAPDITHSQDLRRGEFFIDFRACNIGDVFLILSEKLQIFRLFLKIHLFLRRLPHFLYDRAKIHNILRVHRKIQNAGGFPHQHNVL